MFMNIASGAILALLVCTLVVCGAERNIQEVLEERYKQLATESSELGSLAVSKELIAEPAITEEQEPTQETTASHCKCQQAAEIPTIAKPEAAKPSIKHEQEKTKGCKIESATLEETAELVRGEVSPPLACEKAPVAVVEAIQNVQAETVLKDELVMEEPVEKKAGKKEKNKNKNKKREKRDTKGGKTKSSNKSNSKRSNEGKSKNKDKKSRK